MEVNIQHVHGEIIDLIVLTFNNFEHGIQIYPIILLITSYSYTEWAILHLAVILQRFWRRSLELNAVATSHMNESCVHHYLIDL